jgi:hypothetical protein
MSTDDTRAGEVAAEEVDLAETLRDERLQPCDHSTKGWPDCCVTCLRDRLLASDWLAEVRRTEYERGLADGRCAQ